ncbi:hypothetical protein MNV49_000709 [Pseudohyphozyma bogoriensis]|nr:hypothetical protein MNV49_000709 [Pseudohyphozyma bogoriensis]
MATSTTIPVGGKAPIWWSNAIFFVGMHVVALYGACCLSPWWELDRRTAWITIGYHRLWAHKAFTASFPLRVVLAGMGCLGFQGSIKWWVLRHRLHHRFTDTESDPYNAKEGLWHSHVGWIFRKPNYPRMPLIDQRDLNVDPARDAKLTEPALRRTVVRFQHRHYLPLTLGLGLGLPTVVGWCYGDAVGGYIWGGVIARILIWHFTFFINSLAHYIGEQAYSEDVTARGNFLLAIFTGGEANHNYHHAFPSDYRNGPRVLDWDPTKWTIYLLHHFTPFIPSIKQTPTSEILKAQAHVLSVRAHRSKTEEMEKEDDSSSSSFAMWSSYASAGSATSEESAGGGSETSLSSTSEEEEDDLEGADELLENTPLMSTVLARRGGGGIRNRGGMKNEGDGRLPTWSKETLVANVTDMRNRSLGSTSAKLPLVVLISGYAVDCTNYAMDHPGGVAVLREFAVRGSEAEEEREVRDATEAFGGGLNDHGWSARERMRELRIARVVG